MTMTKVGIKQTHGDLYYKNSCILIKINLE